MLTCRHYTLTVHGIMDSLREQPMCISVSCFFHRHINLPKNMIITQCKSSPDALRAVDCNDQNVFSIGTLEADSDLSTDAHLNVSTVHYKTDEHNLSQTSRHNLRQTDDSLRLVLEWQNKAHLPEKSSAFRDKFVAMSAKFQLKWIRHLGHMNVVSVGIKLVTVQTPPVHSAPYCAMAQTRESGKIKIEKM